MTAFVTFAACWSFGYTVMDLIIKVYENHQDGKYDEVFQKTLNLIRNQSSTAPSD